MSDFLPPVVAVLAANITEYTAGLVGAQARMDEFIVAQNAALTEMQAKFATAGTGAAEMGAGFTEASLAADRMAVQTGTSMRSIQTEIARSAETTKLLGTSAEQAAVKWEASLAAMQAETAALSAGMAREQRLVAAGWADVAVAEEAAAAKAAAATGPFGISKTALLGIGAAAVGVAYETTKMAGDFNVATERLVTSAGEIQSNVDMVRKGILTMAGQVGYSAGELAKAMYTVESGGQHGAAGLKVLQAAAEGAKTENADLKEVADAVTSVLVDYHLKAEDAASVTSKLVAATSAGKTTFQELASSMAAVLPVASANHVALDDVLGDLASMTVHGMSAQQAAQNLTDAIRHMAAPTQLQSKELAILGVKSQDLSDMLGAKGLSGTIDYIGDHIRAQMGPGASKVILDLGTALNGLNPKVQELAGHVLDGSMTMKEYTKAAGGLDVVSAKQAISFAALAGSTHTIGSEQLSSQAIMQSYTKAMRDAMGDATGLNVALMIGGENSKVTAAAIKTVSGATAEAGGHVKGWADIQAEFNVKLAQAKDGFGALAISIGEKLLPVLTPLVGALATSLQFLSAHPAAATALAIVIGGVLVVALSAAAVAAWSFTYAMLANPAVWIVAAIVAVIALLGLAAYELIEHWQGVKDFFKWLWDGVKGFFSGAWDFIKGIVDKIKGAWDSFVGGFQNPGAKLAESVKGFDRFFIDAGATVKRGVETVKRALSTVYHDVTDPFVKGFDTVKQFLSLSPAEMGRVLGQSLGRLTRDLIDDGKKMWHGFQDGVTTAYHETVDWFVALPGRIKTFVMDSGRWIRDKGVELWHGAHDGIVTAYHETVDWFVALPGRVKAFLIGAGTWIKDKGAELWHGAQDGVVDGYHATIDWFVALPGRVKDFFANAGTWLLQAGKDIMSGLWEGIKSFFGKISDGIKGFIGGFIGGFQQGFRSHSPSQVMHNIGSDVMAGFGQGFDSQMGYLSGLPGRAYHTVADFFGNAASWLSAAGNNVIIGLGNGMSAWAGWLWSKASSIAQGALNAAKSALGIASPSTLAAEAGMFLVHGLALGITDHADVAVTAARNMASRVAGAMRGITGSAQMNLTAAVTSASSALTGPVFQPSASGGEGGVGDTHINMNVAGHVWTVQGLVKELQQQLLRHGIRNVTPGINYSFA